MWEDLNQAHSEQKKRRSIEPSLVDVFCLSWFERKAQGSRLNHCWNLHCLTQDPKKWVGSRFGCLAKRMHALILEVGCESMEPCDEQLGEGVLVDNNGGQTGFEIFLERA
jgi:hypothetical protein